MRVGIDCRGIDSSSWYRGIGEVFRATLYSLAKHKREKTYYYNFDLVLIGPSVDISFLPDELLTVYSIDSRPTYYDVLHVIDNLS